MARFSDNPIKNPLAGSELIPATDPSTGDDIALTPVLITIFAQQNMGLASGSNQGSVSGPNGDKLTALRTNAATDLLLAQLGQIPFPIFIGTPVNGTIEIYKNVLGNDVVFDFMYLSLASGSSNLTVNINGTPITGWSGINVTSTPSAKVTATAAKTLHADDVLSLTFAGSSTPTNLRASLKGNLTLT